MNVRRSGPASDVIAAVGAQPIVRTQLLSHFFQDGGEDKQVLFDNNLEIYPGEIVIMTGPSGSGKTTLLTLIGALRTVQHGSVQTLGKELRGLGSKELVAVLSNIGFIFQAHNLFWSLSALENVKMALELKDRSSRDRERRAVEILSRLGLEEKVKSRPAQLSGGQRQRVAIARALANSPRLILADEPTAALDERSGREVVDLLKDLAKKEQCTCLIVTHDNRILDVANRLIHMVGGKIVSNVLGRESVQVVEFLRRFPEFAKLSLLTLATVFINMEKETHPAGTEIIRQGEIGDKLYLIWKGNAKVVRDGQDVAALKEGEIFGEAALLTPGEGRRNATVKALDTVETYVLRKEHFDAVLKSSDTFNEEMLEIYRRRLRERPQQEVLS